jgi:hypothetical protein
MKYFILILVHLSVSYCFAESSISKIDTINSMAKLNYSSQLLKTIALPCWASYKSENYIISSVQLGVDVYSLAVFFTGFWGSGDMASLGILMGPIFLGAHRIVSIPINLTETYIYNNYEFARNAKVNKVKKYISIGLVSCGSMVLLSFVLNETHD